MKDVYVLELDYDGCYANYYKKKKDEKVIGNILMKGLIWNKYSEKEMLLGKLYVHEGSYIYNELKYAIDNGTIFNGEMDAIYNELDIIGGPLYEYGNWLNGLWKCQDYIDNRLDFGNKKMIKDIIEQHYGTSILDKPYREK